MDCLFFSSSYCWHLKHNGKAAQELASLDSVQIAHSICWELLFTSLHPSSEAKPLGSDRAPWKTTPVSLSKAETMKFDGSSSRVGKVVDSVLLKSDIWWIMFPPARTAGISSTTAKQHKKLLDLFKIRKIREYGAQNTMLAICGPTRAIKPWVWLLPKPYQRRQISTYSRTTLKYTKVRPYV